METIAAQSKRKVPCKTPASAATCYWTHGRLGFNNGTPAFRLWKIGTDRLLGIYSGQSTYPGDNLDNEDPEFPADVKRLFHPPKNGPVFADFEICPLEPERPRVMQAACIESAKNVFVDQ